MISSYFSSIESSDVPVQMQAPAGEPARAQSMSVDEDSNQTLDL